MIREYPQKIARARLFRCEGNGCSAGNRGKWKSKTERRCARLANYLDRVYTRCIIHDFLRVFQPVIEWTCGTRGNKLRHRQYANAYPLHLSFNDAFMFHVHGSQKRRITVSLFPQNDIREVVRARFPRQFATDRFQYVMLYRCTACNCLFSSSHRG